MIARYDVVVAEEFLFVVVESDLLPPDPSVVVIPLLADYPSIRWLCPTIVIDDMHFVLATRLIGNIPKAKLRRSGNVAEQADVITRAVDILMSGV